jgi:N-glycosidase YbiA
MPPKPPDNRILYFGRDCQELCFLSHFYPSPIEIDGETWPTVEHFYEAQKSVQHPYQQAIRDAETPGMAKRLGNWPAASSRAARGSWFAKHGKLPRADWDRVKLDIMRRADWAKFSRNPDLAELLLATADAELIEDSPSDGFWGIGRDGNGANWAGRVLSEVRDRLRG